MTVSTRRNAMKFGLGLIGSSALAFATVPALAQTIIGTDPEMIREIRAGNIDGVKTRVIKGDNPTITDFDGMNGIAIAARNSDFTMMDYLLQVGVGVNVADKFGNVPLHWATEDDDYDVAVYLLENGADVNTRNGRGLTPVMVAARNGSIDILELYIDEGADLNVRDYTGRSALDWGRDSRTPGLERALIDAGAQ